MNRTKIDWCDCTLNPVVGCTYGCPFCYARRMNNRFEYVKEFTKPQFFPERLKQLYNKVPNVIFMDSMSDIADWEYNCFKSVLKAMRDNPQHTYLFLTKRPVGFIDYQEFTNQPNVWFGVSACTANAGHCITDEAGFITGNKFISVEPILEDIAEFIDWENFKWVIVGAETGKRKCKVIPRREWIQNIVDQCHAVGVPVFFKSSLAQIWDAPLVQEMPQGIRLQIKRKKNKQL